MKSFKEFNGEPLKEVLAKTTPVNAPAESDLALNDITNNYINQENYQQ